MTARKLLPVAQQYAHHAVKHNIPRRSIAMRDAFVAQHGEVATWSKAVLTAWTQMSGAMLLDEIVIGFCAGFETAAASVVTRDGGQGGPSFTVDRAKIAALGKEIVALIEFAMPEVVS